MSQRKLFRFLNPWGQRQKGFTNKKEKKKEKEIFSNETHKNSAVDCKINFLVWLLQNVRL